MVSLICSCWCPRARVVHPRRRRQTLANTLKRTPSSLSHTHTHTQSGGEEHSCEMISGLLLMYKEGLREKGVAVVVGGVKGRIQDVALWCKSWNRCERYVRMYRQISGWWGGGGGGGARESDQVIKFSLVWFCFYKEQRGLAFIVRSKQTDRCLYLTRQRRAHFHMWF